MRWRSATLPEESRVARPFGSAAKLGRLASHPSGSSRFCIRSISSLRSGYFDLYAFISSDQLFWSRRPRFADAGVEMFTHTLGDEELGVFRPAIAALRQTDFFVTERLAMRGAGVVLMGRAVADVAVDDDQRRHVVRLPEGFDRLVRAARCRWRRRRAARSSHRQGSAPPRRR